MSVEEGSMSHHPIDDENKQYTLEAFIATAKKELDDYERQFAGGNEYHRGAHTWDEWMATFKRYMSW